MALDFNKEIQDIINNKEALKIEQQRLFKVRKKENTIMASEMMKHGIEIDSVYDFVNTDEPYPDAIEPLLYILENHLVKDDVIIEGIVRALTRKYAKGKVEKRLLKQYYILTNKQRTGILGAVIGNAIEYLYSDDYFDDVVEIVKNKKNGMSRQMFVLSLGKTKKHREEVEDLLLDLTHDDDVRLHAIDALKKLKSKSNKVKNRIKELAKNSDKTIRKKAESYLKKLL